MIGGAAVEHVLRRVPTPTVAQLQRAHSLSGTARFVGDPEHVQTLPAAESLRDESLAKSNGISLHAGV